jgi:hypothetical protein
MILCNICGNPLNEAGVCEQCRVGPASLTTSGRVAAARTEPQRPVSENVKRGVTPERSDHEVKNKRIRFGTVHLVILVLAILLLVVMATLFLQGQRQNATASQQSAISNSTIDVTPSKNISTQSASTPQTGSRYAVDSCGVIADTRTGLEWLVGPDRNVTWYEAQQWISELQACGGGWRMPTITEIMTLHNPATTAGTGFYKEGRYFPAHIDPVFNAIGGGSWVWASERSATGDAQSFNLNQGKAVSYSATNTTYSTRAFAVRKH